MTLLAAGIANAAPPAGWAGSDDGGYTHVESGAECPPAIENFELQRLIGPTEPATLGTCEYADPDGRRGEIQVRRYVPGIGETELAIQNDRVLMEGPGPDIEPGTEILSGYRVGPGPEIDGAPTQRVMHTVVRRGLLVDCAAWVKKSQDETGGPTVEFAVVCLHMPGG